VTVLRLPQDPMMKLYHAPVSPFVRMVRVLLIETGLDGRVTLEPVTGTPVAPASLPLAQNPIGKIPVLQTPEGMLYDSRVICRYVDHMAGGVAYPAPPALWDVLVVEATAHGMAEAAVLMVYEGRVRPPEARSEPWVDAQWARIARAAAVLERDRMPYLERQPAGCPDMGQIAVAVVLGYCDFRLAGRDWRDGNPRLAAWQAAFAARPAMRATEPHDPV
jgi:glutathione S-transferase